MEGGGNGSSDLSTHDELELGLGLSLGGGGGGAWGRILTAKDFSCIAKRTDKVCNFTSHVSGLKRTAADSEGGGPLSQVVGWPPIRSYRMNSLANDAKASRSEEEEEEKPISDKEKSCDAKKKICNGNDKASVNEKGHLDFVKVNVDGIPIGRKVGLNAHVSYETLAQSLEDMFFEVTANATEKEQTKTSKLLDGFSEFVLTYEDKEGDWLLIGDIPWGMFLSSIRRFRILRTTDANKLTPRFQDTNEKQRSSPV